MVTESLPCARHCSRWSEPPDSPLTQPLALEKVRVWDPQNTVPLGVQTDLREPPLTSLPPSQLPSRSGEVSGLPGLRGWCPVPPCQGRGWADCPQILGSSQNHSTSVLPVNNLQDFIVQRVLRFVFKMENIILLTFRFGRRLAVF